LATPQKTANANYFQHSINCVKQSTSGDAKNGHYNDGPSKLPGMKLQDRT